MLRTLSKSLWVAIVGATIVVGSARADHKDWRSHEVYGDAPSPCAHSSESRACQRWLHDHHRQHGPHHHHHFHGEAKG